MSENSLLSTKNLSIKTGEKTLVNELSFNLEKGKTLGIVGESGSGKSLTSLAVMGLLPKSLQVSGDITFKGQHVLKLKEKQFLKIRGKQIAMIFQEPMTALNPTMKCGPQVREIMLRHLKIDHSTAKKRTIELFKKVELPRPESIYNSYPHQISGGQKQRVMIAMAISCKPEILIADEPTTALDASVQKGILLLLNELRNEYGMGMIFISHDLGVVRHVADDILVMHRGHVKEYGSAKQVFNRPKDPYTKGLLACRPTPETTFVRLPVVNDFLQGKRPRLKLRTAKGREVKVKELTHREPLFEIKKVDKYFKGKNGIFKKPETVHALHDVNLKVFPGETLGLVGESGSGKTTLGRILCGLEKANEGEIFYKHHDISTAGSREWRKLHREIQIIFQDPFSSLNPRIKVGPALEEAMINRPDIKGKARRREVETLLEKVGLEKSHYGRYPHEFSGGQRQRIGIARALAMKPQFIVCDESVSALDVSVQAQILNLLNDLKDEFDFTYLFISHDLAVVKYFADRIAVLRNGELVESGGAEEVYHHPKTDYTQNLIEAVFE